MPITPRRLAALLLLVAPLAAGVFVRAQAPPPAPPEDPITTVIRQVERGVLTGNAREYLSVVARGADRAAAVEFCGDELQPGATRAVIHERDRGELENGGYRVIADMFAEYGDRARASTWRLDFVPQQNAEGQVEWRIADQERLSSIENIYRLSIDPGVSYAVRDLSITSEDVELKLEDGSVFVANTQEGVAAVVLTGRGRLIFSPTPQVEKRQVEIFSGSTTLDDRFDAAYIRMNPSDFDRQVAPQLGASAQPDPRDYRRAVDVFAQDSLKSFNLDLGDLTPEPWWYIPNAGDFLAEVHTRRFDTLTYAHARAEDEDVSLFDRKRKINISLYASEAKLAARGRFYNENSLVDFDVLDYDVNLAVDPGRRWLDGVAHLRVRISSESTGRIILRLANPLVARSVVSDEFGRLFAVRVRGQSSLVVNLPTVVTKGTELGFTIEYSGRLDPEPADMEALQQDPGRGGGGFGTNQEPDPFAGMPMELVLQSSWLYTGHTGWYPQSTVTDYATARIQISLPPQYACVASGDPDGEPALETGADGQVRRVYRFTADTPLRYLGVIISRFTHLDPLEARLTSDPDEDANLPPFDGSWYQNLSVGFEATPRQTSRGRELQAQAARIATFYGSLLDDFPYPSFTVAMIENTKPGGHSPGYMAVLNQPVPGTPWTWRSDPTVFSSYPEFFIAHELAHQWWGQAVGWRNYHEQWLSEGFAQYFAALYAQHERGDDTFGGILHQMRDWAMDRSDQGPVYLGYRIGHVKGDSRDFRAIVYNKGAAVLHMLRRLLGDDVFFRGIRRFYRESRFKKVGTDDFRKAMEEESGRPLDRFFERWIYSAGLPEIRYSSHVVTGADGRSDLVLHVEQKQKDEVYDVPVTFTVEFADRSKTTVVVPMTERMAELRVPVTQSVRRVDFDEDDGTLADVERE
jgi:hypothetical protein